MKLIICGALGKMGKAITALAPAAGCEVVLGVDPFGGSSIKDCQVKADVVVCVLAPTSEDEIKAMLAYCVENNTPLVVCTTALSPEINGLIKATGGKIGVFYSANMSLGVNVLANMVRKMSKLLHDSGFDIEIIEKHHNQKLDAPSGTALLLANAIREDIPLEIATDRTKAHQARSKNEIGIHAIRGGTIVGEHTIIYAGQHETIEITHRAEARDAFAQGALVAAKFVATQPAGVYNMQDLMS